MVNLLGGWRFSETRSPESEGSQQPIKIGQADDVGCRRAKGHRRANRGIKHPGSDDDRYARFGLNDGNVSARAPFGVQLPDLAAMQRVRAVMDFNILADMGRMNPRWRWAGRHGCSLVPIAAVSEPQQCTRSSSPPYAGPGIGRFMPPARLCRTVLEGRMVVEVLSAVAWPLAPLHSA
jgi:hypothetical protein